MSLFEDKAVCERVNFYSHHIDPQIPNVSGVISLSNGHTTLSTVPDQKYTFTNVSSTDPSSNNHLQLTGQAGGPSPAVLAMDVSPNGQVNFPVGIQVAGQPVGITQNLSQVLAVGNEAGGNDINAFGSDVLCNTMKSIAIEAIGAPIINTIEVKSNLGMIPYSNVDFSRDAKITCNAENIQKTVIETNFASGNTVYKIAEGNLNYDTSNKLLTVNPQSGPEPLLSSQGLQVIGDVLSVYSSGLGPYALVSLNTIGKLINPLLNKLGVVSVANDLSSSVVYYDVSSSGVGTPSSWIPDQLPPVDGSDNTWSHTKPAGSAGLGVKINWFPFNPYYPSAPSIGPVPGPYFTKKDLKAVWAVITPLVNIATQGAIFFNIFSYDNVNGSSTYFTNRWDYCANNLALPLTTGALTLQAGFKYLIYCYDAPKIVATPSTLGTITQANGQYPSQTSYDLMKDPFDIHTDIPHIGFSAVALNALPTPQPSDPTNIPISGICLSTTSSQLTSVLSFNVHSIGYRVIGGSASAFLDYEYNLQYN